MVAWNFAHCDGFDKYGVVGSVFNPANPPCGGDWTIMSSLGSSGVSTGSIAASLAGPGTALLLATSGDYVSNSGPQRSLPGSYARCTGTVVLNTPLTLPQGIIWGASGAGNLSMYINTAGRVVIARGSMGAAVIATSVFTAVANSTHTYAWDFTFDGSAGVIKVNIDGAIDANLNLTGQNTGAVINSVQLAMGDGTLGIVNGNGTFDHYYARYYTSAGGSDPPPLSNPRIETDFPSGDQSVAFTPTAGVLGSDYSITGNTNAPGANELALRRWTPNVSATINSVSILPEATSAGAKFKGVIYADNAGSPTGGALLSSGTEVVGCTSGTLLTLPLVTPQSLTAGTPVWIGYITDTSVVIAQVDTTTVGQKAANTYASGAPGTGPSMTTGQPSWIIFGNLTGMANNWPQVSNGFSNYGLGTPSYNLSSTVNAQDLFAFPSITGSPPTIVTAAVKAYLERSDSGARTMNLQMKSVSTTGNGDNAGFTAGLTFGWAGSFFDADPATSVTWVLANLNAANPGYQIAS